MPLKRSLSDLRAIPAQDFATDGCLDPTAFLVELKDSPPHKKQALIAPSMPTLLPPSPPVDEPVKPAPILALPNEILLDVIALVASHSHKDALAFSSTCKTIRVVVSISSTPFFCLFGWLLEREKFPYQNSLRYKLHCI